MPVFRFGLSLAALGFLYVSWASWSAGYWPEVALLRGLVAFMAVSLLAYVGELVVATAPPPAGQQAEYAQPSAEYAQPSAESRARVSLPPNAAAADGAEERSDPALETGEHEQMRAA